MSAEPVEIVPSPPRAAGKKPNASDPFQRWFGMPWDQVPPGLWLVRGGAIAGLALRCLVELATPGLSWRREFVIQCANIFRLAFVPIFVINVLIGFTGTGIQGGAVLEAFGAIDRAGAVVPIALLREGAPIITGTVMAGVIGTTITAELGARKIREELEALRVMGIDPVRNLVLPRVVALTVVMLVLNMLAVVGGVLGAYAGAVGLLNGTSGSFFTQALANTNYIDLWASEVKAFLFGAMIGVVACQKGLEVKGGAEGVGRAVNESVVANLIGVGMVGLLFTAIFLALYPDIFVLR